MRGTLVVFSWLLLLARAQPLPSLSLPAQISVPPPWHSLPLSQADLGLLFSNSSPFSHSQSLLLLPPARGGSKPGLRASFGPYSVTQQLVSEPILPLSPPLSAWMLSKRVLREREGERGERFKVRVLFRMRGDASRGACITLHAFRETAEQKASCITQPPLGLCVVSLALPKEWFESDPSIPPVPGHTHRQRHGHRHWPGRGNRGRRRQNVLGALRSSPALPSDLIQLYYSSYGTTSDLKTAPPRCVEDEQHQLQRKLLYIGSVTLEAKSNTTRQEAGCTDGQEEEELRLDSSVVIRYHKGPVRAGQPVGVSVNLRSNFSGESMIVRLKVKKGLLSLVAQSSLNSDLWAVTLERTSGSKHNIISIICRRVGIVLDGYSPSSLQQVACLWVEGLKRSFDVAMTVTTSWWVEYSSRSTAVPPRRAVTTFLTFTDREIVGIAPITESNTIINTAILTSQPVSLPVIVLAVGQDGKVSDVTSTVKCQSSNEDIVKVSSDCSALFVDGSESGEGSTCVVVEFSLGMLSGSLCLSVWAPVVPLRVALSDPILSPIHGWSYYSESGCAPVYQRSTVQVLAQFSAQPSAQGGQLTYMLGSPDWFVDVTELVRDWLRVENPRVAALDKQSYLVGLEPGTTSLHVTSSQWDGVLGSAYVTVNSDPVTPGDLSVQLVGGLGLSFNPSPAHPSIITATVTAHNILYNFGQEASISIWLQFADETAVLVSAFSAAPYSLRLSSLAETVVTVTPAPSQRVLAQGDGGGPLLKAELLVSTCEPMSNHVEANAVTRDRGGGIRRLAKGSGWIRVNLDSEIWPMSSEDSDFDMLDVSDMLVESDDGYKDLYGNYGDKRASENSTTDYDVADGDGMVGRNKLERAVLTPNHEESGVYFSPGAERESEGGRLAESELEIGVGAILSLLCLSSLLILVNCLPCALKERRRRRQKVKEGRGMEGEEGGIEGEEEAEEEKETPAVRAEDGFGKKKK